MKDEDISNRTLALLVGAAIVVSLVGIFSIQAPQVVYTLTGYAYGATANATIGAEVTRNVAITVAGAIAFGSGYIFQNNSDEAIELNSTGGLWKGTDGRCAPENTTFAGATCTMSDDTDNKITVRNDGNVNVTVIMALNTTSAANLGLGPAGDIGFWLGQEESATVGSAIRPACLNSTGNKVPGADNNKQFPAGMGFRATTSGRSISFFGVPQGVVTQTNATICEKLQPDDNYDTVNVTIYMNISKQTTTGGHNYLINFTATDTYPTEG